MSGRPRSRRTTSGRSSSTARSAAAPDGVRETRYPAPSRTAVSAVPIASSSSTTSTRAISIGPSYPRPAYVTPGFAGALPPVERSFRAAPYGQDMTTNLLEPELRPTARTMLNKVPEVTVFFWLIKVLATTVGETAADFLNEHVGLGLTGTSIVAGALLAIVLAVQFAKRLYVPSVYWLAVVMIS